MSESRFNTSDMIPLDSLFAKNQEWARSISQADPDFFPALSRQQAPEFLWIGCADSRVPANEICGLLPGELFVHRNVANVVVPTDFNCLSVMQFAIDVLKVRHVMVVGHYGCGGVRATLLEQKLGLVDNWLRHVQDVKRRYLEHLTTFPTEAARVDRLCELNVIHQVLNAAQSYVAEDAWARGQALAFHGWIYGLHDGLVRSVGISIASPEQLQEALQTPWAEKQAWVRVPPPLKI